MTPETRCETKAIELWLATPRQLFNSLDPSPFHEKDLDRDADEYITGYADEFPLAQSLDLVIHLPVDQMALVEENSLETAIHNYFTYRLKEARRHLRFHFRDGRSALAIGLGFLSVCMTLRQLLGVFADGRIGPVLQEGLLILGWVAMWRPLQIFLYDWWPMRHNVKLFEKLSAVPVEVRIAGKKLAGEP